MTTLKLPITAEDHVKGPEGAQITLVEYGDYQCLSCSEAHEIIKELLPQTRNKLRYVFRHFPITSIHPMAEEAAEAAEFAAKHNKFWEMHDLIYENQENLSLSLLLELAGLIRLPEKELNQAIELGTYKQKIKDGFLEGVRSGVNGTPSFFINNERYNGSFAEIDDVILKMTR